MERSSAIRLKPAAKRALRMPRSSLAALKGPLLELKISAALSRVKVDWQLERDESLKLNTLLLDGLSEIMPEKMPWLQHFIC